MRRCLKRLLENESERCKKCSDKQECEADQRLVLFGINHGVLRGTSRVPTLESLNSEATRVPMR